MLMYTSEAKWRRQSLIDNYFLKNESLIDNYNVFFNFHLFFQFFVFLDMRLYLCNCDCYVCLFFQINYYKASNYNFLKCNDNVISKN